MPPAISVAIIKTVDELERQLKKRDPRFLIRLFLLIALTLIGGYWGFMWLRATNPGGCVARGFGLVTEEPPAESGER